MKRLFIFIAMMSASFIHAQNSWNIVLHKKVLLTGKEVNEEKNVKPVKSSDWKKTGYLEVYFKEGQPSEWKHSIQLSDEGDNPLIVKDGVLSTKISTSVLRKTFAGKKQVKIYMKIDPPNPMMMAPSRIIHLATLKLP